jgi:hypothetical protein
VSSYGRNAFTRGHSCLCLVRSPLYTSAAATCPGSPRLRRRGGDSGLKASRFIGCPACASTSPGRDVPDQRVSSMVRSDLRRRSTAVRTFGAEGRRRHVGSFLHNKTHMAQAALAFRQRPYCEGFPTRPKPYTDRRWLAWPNEGDASEDQLPQHLPHVAGRRSTSQTAASSPVDLRSSMAASSPVSVLSRASPAAHRRRTSRSPGQLSSPSIGLCSYAGRARAPHLLSSLAPSSAGPTRGQGWQSARRSGGSCPFAASPRPNRSRERDLRPLPR